MSQILDQNLMIQLCFASKVEHVNGLIDTDVPGGKYS